MNSTLKKIHVLSLFGIIGLAGLTAHTSEAKNGFLASAKLFPTSKCAVTESLERSRALFEATHSFIHPQGIFPWPGVSDNFSVDGIWVNNTRGTYVVLQQIEDNHSPRYGALYIRFYSACTHQLLAEGTRILSRRDWELPEVSIPLKNYALKGSWLRAYIRVNVEKSCAESAQLEIQIREARVGSRDHFFMDRFE